MTGSATFKHSLLAEELCNALSGMALPIGGSTHNAMRGNRIVRIIHSVALIAAATATALSAQQPATADASAPLGIVGPAFFAVSVADLEASAAWYRRVFGVEPVREVASRDGQARARVLRRGEVVIELIHYEGSVPRTHALEPRGHDLQVHGLFKAGIFVADASAAYAKLQELGVDVDPAIILDEPLAWQTFIFRDLDGNRIQVFASCSDCGPG